MNDLIELINTEIKLYADDITLYVAYTESDRAKAQMEENLENIQRWATKWFVKFNPEKTVGLKFSRKRQPQNIDIVMAGEIIEQTERHKHLGLAFQKDGKWTEQIQSISTKATRRIDILRNLGNKLDRESLNKLYVAFIRPILEQNNIVWSNCTQGEAEKLELVQLKAARAVCGAKKGTSHRELYEEIKWETLKDRRERQCLIMLFKMKHRLTPETLSNLLPQQRADRTEYSIRNSDRITIPRTKSTQYQTSFLPATITKWNKLPAEIRQATSLEQFKESIIPKIEKPPKYYNEGSRREQKLFCRLRVQNADLNSNLFRRNLTDTEECKCGHPNETTEHFLLECPEYVIDRRVLQIEVQGFGTLTAENLLKGSLNLNETQNRKLYLAVQTYITATKRFDPE
jgi:hypothetical protein